MYIHRVTDTHIMQEPESWYEVTLSYPSLFHRLG